MGKRVQLKRSKDINAYEMHPENGDATTCFHSTSSRPLLQDGIVGNRRRRTPTPEDDGDNNLLFLCTCE
ncbi:hypothetical protein L3Y34_010492 [Caenorhabditis briggsae]|uniref:Uncharacterized protein n=1 Tax=Caenorhabditis briggsae TaxID=6238 RepID=A0AAE9CSP3_CAEBR|nr:hypothetical protein L3Y34_010492 [Caenorhabditis briggsae]